MCYLAMFLYDKVCLNDNENVFNECLAIIKDTNWALG